MTIDFGFITVIVLLASMLVYSIVNVLRMNKIISSIVAIITWVIIEIYWGLEFINKPSMFLLLAVFAMLFLGVVCTKEDVKTIMKCRRINNG